MPDRQLGPDITVRDSTNQKILATCRELAFSPEANCSIYVDSRATDEISEPILNHRYGFPVGFNVLLAVVKPGARVLDLGAHIGVFSLFAAASGHHVASVEASPQNVALLEESVRENGFTTVQVVPVAVSDHGGQVEFFPFGPYGFVSNAMSKSMTDAVPITIPAVTVDSLLGQIGWDTVDFVKLDVEGSEVAVLSGMSRLLAREDAPIIFYESNGHTLNWFGQTPGSLMATLERHGYRCYLVDPGRLIPCQSGDLQPGVCVDYLAVKQPLPQLKRWQVSSPMSRRDQIARSLATCTASHPQIRAYIARALAHADSSILSDRQIVKALDSLATDKEPAVREAAAWWLERKPARRGVLDDVLQLLTHRPKKS